MCLDGLQLLSASFSFWTAELEKVTAVDRLGPSMLWRMSLAELMRVTVSGHLGLSALEGQTSFVQRPQICQPLHHHHQSCPLRFAALLYLQHHDSIIYAKI